MKGRFERIIGKTPILRILMVFAILTLDIKGHLKGVEGAMKSSLDQMKHGWINNYSKTPLTESEAEEVSRIWRVIAGQEIVNWDGKEWLAMSELQKKEAINKACEAWRRTGYQKIESVDYFVKDINKYYRHHRQKNPREGLKTKVGLVLSLSAFFSGIEGSQEQNYGRNSSWQQFSKYPFVAGESWKSTF